MKRIAIGSITLGTKVFVADPCYNSSVWCSKIVSGVKPGVYLCEVEKSEENGRNFGLIATHYDYRGNEHYRLTSAMIGVDSGQAGIYDYHHHEALFRDEVKMEAWYNKACNRTLSDIKAGTIDAHSVVSATGYGDGMYLLSLCRNEEGEIVGFYVSFE